MEGQNNEHAIPQNIMSVEFKLIGDLTIKQFVFVAIPLLLGFLMFVFKVNNYITLVFTGIFLLAALFIDFIPLDDRPLDEWIINFIIAVKNPTQRIWGKKPSYPNILRIPKAIMPKVKKNEDVATFLYQSPLDTSIQSSSGNSATKILDDKEKNFMSNIDNINDSLGDNVSINAGGRPVISPAFNIPTSNNFQNNPTKEDVSSNTNPTENVPFTTGDNSKNKDDNLLSSRIGNEDPKNFYKPEKLYTEEREEDSSDVKKTIPSVDASSMNANPFFSQDNPFGLINTGNHVNPVPQQSNESFSTVPSTPEIKDENPNLDKADKIEDTSFREGGVNILDLSSQMDSVEGITIPSVNESISNPYDNATVATPIDITKDSPPQEETVEPQISNVSENDNIAPTQIDNAPVDESINPYDNATVATPIDIAKDTPPQEEIVEPQISNVSENDNIAQTQIDNVPVDESINPYDNATVATPIDIAKDTSPQEETVEPQISNVINKSPESNNEMNEMLERLKKLEEENSSLKKALETTSSTPSPQNTNSSINSNFDINDFKKYLPEFVNNPNVIAGVLVDSQGNIIQDAVIIIKDSSQKPIRAIKSNQLGQFFIRTPLPDGNYTLEVTHPKFAFESTGVDLTGVIKEPILIYSKT